MTTAATSGPIPLSQVLVKGRVFAEDLTGEDLSDVLELHADASAWWVLPRDADYGAAELRDVAHALQLDDLAIKDLLADDHRAKFEAISGARLVITNYVSYDERLQQVTTHPISIIATDRALICLVDEGAFAAKLLRHQEGGRPDGVDAGLQQLVRAVIGTYESAVEWLEGATDDLSTLLFDERPLRKDEQVDAFRLRAALSQLRRTTEPMRAVVGDLVDEPLPTPKGKRPPSGDTSRQWRVIAEQHTRAANAADALRESLSSVFDTSLALADARMNTIMEKLTGWAAIIAVPTLVTGFVGMNVSFPLDGTVLGFWVSLVIMVVASLILFIAFRRRHWI